MTVEVKLFQSLEDVGREAGDQLARANQPSIYDRLNWFEMTAQHCGRAGRPLIAHAGDGENVAWLFLCRQDGKAAEALASWYTLEFNLVGSRDSSELIETMANSLHDLRHIQIARVANPEPIVAGFRAAGWKAFTAPCTVNWYIDPPASFEQFWKERPGKLRSTAKRKGKKAGLDIAIHRAFDEQAWADYRAVYEQSWKPEEGSWPFLRAFAESEGAAGTLRLGIAYREGAPIAAQLWHVENGRATIHKLAYAESAKQLSPGTILSEAMFRHVIEQDRPRRIDYGTGDESYKADWMEHVRPLYAIDLYNPRRIGAWPALARKYLSGLVRHRPTD
ncbi:MAG: GNAT family N-acetyltransferase [Parasphingopyxis sp.]|nr:GNAT family N-acetyltransferase [Sphingomonadales bacterium]